VREHHQRNGFLDSRPERDQVAVERDANGCRGIVGVHSRAAEPREVLDGGRHTRFAKAADRRPRTRGDAALVSGERASGHHRSRPRDIRNRRQVHLDPGRAKLTPGCCG
jgi:hypothetical protein